MEMASAEPLFDLACMHIVQRALTHQGLATELLRVFVATTESAGKGFIIQALDTAIFNGELTKRGLTEWAIAHGNMDIVKLLKAHGGDL